MENHEAQSKIQFSPSISVLLHSNPMTIRKPPTSDPVGDPQQRNLSPHLSTGVTKTLHFKQRTPTTMRCAPARRQETRIFPPRMPASKIAHFFPPLSSTFLHIHGTQHTTYATFNTVLHRHNMSYANRNSNDSTTTSVVATKNFVRRLAGLTSLMLLGFLYVFYILSHDGSYKPHSCGPECGTTVAYCKKISSNRCTNADSGPGRESPRQRLSLVLARPVNWCRGLKIKIHSSKGDTMVIRFTIRTVRSEIRVEMRVEIRITDMGLVIQEITYLIFDLRRAACWEECARISRPIAGSNETGQFPSTVCSS